MDICVDVDIDMGPQRERAQEQILKKVAPAGALPASFIASGTIIIMIVIIIVINVIVVVIVIISVMLIIIIIIVIVIMFTHELTNC